MAYSLSTRTLGSYEAPVDGFGVRRFYTWLEELWVDGVLNEYRYPRTAQWTSALPLVPTDDLGWSGGNVIRAGSVFVSGPTPASLPTLLGMINTIIQEWVFVGTSTGATINCASPSGIAGPTYTNAGGTQTSGTPLPDEYMMRPSYSAQWQARTPYAGYLFGPGTLAPPVNTPPVVNNFTPTTGTSITKYQHLEFDVTDAEGLLRSMVLVTFGDGTYEVIHDGDVFASKYASRSTRTPITGGHHFTVLPASGWTSSPTIRVMAVDTGGLEPV